MKIKQDDWVLTITNERRIFLDVLGKMGERHFKIGHRESISALNDSIKILKRK